MLLRGGKTVVAPFAGAENDVLSAITTTEQVSFEAGFATPATEWKDAVTSKNIETGPQRTFLELLRFTRRQGTISCPIAMVLKPNGKRNTSTIRDGHQPEVTLSRTTQQRGFCKSSSPPGPAHETPPQRRPGAGQPLHETKPGDLPVTAKTPEQPAE
jgi:hypothetical protein